MEFGKKIYIEKINANISDNYRFVKVICFVEMKKAKFGNLYLKELFIGKNIFV